MNFLLKIFDTHCDLEPHGCLGDLGWYTLRFILWMNYAKPKAVTGRLLNSSGRADSPIPPTEFSGEVSLRMYPLPFIVRS